MRMNPARLHASAGAASEFLKSLASPNRLMLLCQLVEGERSVGELAERLHLRDSTVSQHLALLRRERIVSTRRDGQTIYYALANQAAERVLELLYETYCAQKTTRRAP